MTAFYKLIIYVLLFIPRLIFFIVREATRWLVTTLYERMHKESISSDKAVFARLQRKLGQFEHLNRRANEEQMAFKEIAGQLHNGKKLIGIHSIHTSQTVYNPTSDAYDLPKKQIIYYTLYQRDRDTFCIKAYYAGQITKYLEARTGYVVERPEDWESIFEVSGRIAHHYKEMYIDQLFTHSDFRKLGIASIGIEYLKKFAIDNHLQKIMGKMTPSEDRSILQNFYKNRGFEVIIANDLSHDRFLLSLDGLTLPSLPFEFSHEVSNKLVSLHNTQMLG